MLQQESIPEMSQSLSSPDIQSSSRPCPHLFQDGDGLPGRCFCCAPAVRSPDWTPSNGPSSAACPSETSWLAHPRYTTRVELFHMDSPDFD